jgi:hypothetical protein
MKLSEAILLGSSMIPEGVTYTDCAIGAAYKATGAQGTAVLDAEVVWPILKQVVQDPEGLCLPLPMYIIIGKLNGFFTREGRWSRTRIAAWVAEMEAIHDTSPHDPSPAIHDEAIPCLLTKN